MFMFRVDIAFRSIGIFRLILMLCLISLFFGWNIYILIFILLTKKLVFPLLLALLMSAGLYLTGMICIFESYQL